MLFYDCKLTYKCGSRSKLSVVMREKGKRYWGDEIVQDMNDALTGDFELEKMAFMIYRIQPEYFCIILLYDSMEKFDPSQIAQIIRQKMSKVIRFTDLTLNSVNEITAAQAKKLHDIAGTSEYTSYQASWDRGSLGYEYKDFDFDYFDNSNFKIEELLFPQKAISKHQVINEAKRMMLESSFNDELDRIYAPVNPREFYGHPIHYKVLANNSQTALQMASLLCHALYENKRLVSRRLTRIYEIDDGCYHETALDNVFAQSAGSTIIIELQGCYNKTEAIFATHYEEVMKDIGMKVRHYQTNTLFIFVEITERPGFSNHFLSDLHDDIHIIEIKEGRGSREQAVAYLNKLAKQERRMTYTQDELSDALGDKTTFLPSEVNAIYEKLYRSVLQNKTYPSYRQAKLLKVDKNDAKGKDSLKEFNDMIGLNKVKELVKQIRDNARVQQMRSKLGLEQQRNSLHMVFTGNPGSAKTTVARILAKILNNDGILEKGNFIECGRADLVDKYVGGTAPRVRKQFRRAEGGILFIDEAYSLVEKDGLYGDEAINTIVQEMENHREDTIVIFAGYPDKMKSFIAKNEGLKSRISYYVDFPDYNVDELIGILELMANKKGLTIEDDAKEACRDICSRASTQQDFGNGRFVRNLLEQAIMKQSSRIIGEYEGETISKKELSRLTARDFEVNLSELYQEKQRHIGFIA